MKLVPLEYCMHQSSRRIRLPAPVMTSLFPTSLTVFLSMPAPVPLLVQVHPLMRFTSPTEHVSIVTRPCLTAEADKLEHLPWGSVPLRDTSVWSPPTASLPQPTYVPPTVFLTLLAVYSSSHLAGLFHPTTTSRIHVSGVFPAAKPPHLSMCRSLM